MIFDFTTTATVRPELLDITYASHNCFLQGVNFKQCRLFINVDPVPKDTKHSVEDVLNVARKHFGSVIHRTPETPNFSSAINWLWSQAESNFLFHLEDDWELMAGVHVSQMVGLFDTHKNLNMVRVKHKKKSKYKYGLSPCLMRKSFYKAYAGNLDPFLDPEQQLHTRCGEFGIMPRNNGAKGQDPTKITVLAWPKLPVLNHTGILWRGARGISFINKNNELANKTDRVSWE